MDRGDAVEPTGTQKEHLSASHYSLFLQRCVLPRTLSPKVYTLCVQGQAWRYGEQGSKGAVDFTGLVTVAAPGTGLNVNRPQKH